MKKMLLVVVALLFLLSGCNSNENENELEKALNNLENAESLSIDMTIYDLPFFGTMSLVEKNDGDLRFSSNPLSDPTYSKMIDGEEYEYVLSDDNILVLSDTPVDVEDDSSNDSFTDKLVAEDFDEEDGVWVYKGGNIYLDEEETEYMNDIEIVLDSDGEFGTMTFVVYTDEMTTDVEVSISGINATTIVVPENYDD